MRTTMEGRVCVRVSGTTWRGEGEKRERSLCETASAASASIAKDILDFELLFHPLFRCYNAIVLHGPDGRTP